VRLDNLGDVLMTTPALAAIRASLPSAHLTLLTSPAAAVLGPHLPMVDEVWSCSVPWMPARPAGSPFDATELDVGRLAAGHFDAAVIFTVCTQSALPMALLCRMAGIPRRLAHARENPYALLTDWVPETDHVLAGQPTTVRHEVLRQLELVREVGCSTADDRLSFRVLADDRRRAALRLRSAGIAPHGPYAVLHPGASAASRRWPAARFGAVARALLENGCAVVFCGAEGERGLVGEALDAVGAPPTQAPAAALTGAMDVGELAAMIEGARVLVANNSGPAHIAAAVGTPVVALYALTNPQHTPWRVPSRVLHRDVPCRWCLKSVCPQRHHLCLLGVEAPLVADAARELMHTSADTRLEVPA
jgi:lipopolysaccharide heptosyltransferase II